MTTQLSIQRKKRDLTLLAIAGAASLEEPRTGVLAIIDVRVAPTVELERGARLARALNCKLEVLGVAPSRWRAWNRLTRATEELEAVVRNLGLASLTRSVEVQAGSVTTVAIANGIPRRPAIIVIGAMVCDGEIAVAIANAVGSPILVARAQDAGPIVAATTMKHVTYPVLTAAAALSRALAKPAVFFHSADDASGAKRARLRRLASWVGTPTDGTVVCSAAVSDAIIDEATARNADIVSIGSRRRPWFERHRASLAVEVIDRCARSVLVVPMERP